MKIKSHFRSVNSHKQFIIWPGLWFTECSDFDQVVFERFSGQRLPHSSFALDTSFVESPTKCSYLCTTHKACIMFEISRQRNKVYCKLLSAVVNYGLVSDASYDHYRPKVRYINYFLINCMSKEYVYECLCYGSQFTRRQSRPLCFFLCLF